MTLKGVLRAAQAAANELQRPVYVWDAYHTYEIKEKGRYCDWQVHSWLNIPPRDMWGNLFDCYTVVPT